LANFDNIRKDGKFLDSDGEVPEGQGILHQLLNDCYEVLNELQEAALEAGASEDYDEDDEDEEEEEDDE
jgi:hypothetical protein